MTDKHPYTPSQGPLVQLINQLRKSFPQSVNSDTLKKLGIGSQNESRFINVLRFLGILDQEGIKTDLASRIFSLHDDEEFRKEFGGQVSLAYNQLFDLHKEETWNLNLDSLISFFRVTDGSTDIVGKKQAQTFQALAGLSGHGDLPEPKFINPKTQVTIKKKTDSIGTTHSKQKTDQQNNSNQRANQKRELGLTVRIEINLPADGDQNTYDRIFKSIRENLLNE